MNIEVTIRRYLPQIIHMSLATSQDNKPWVCEVHYAYDTDLNLYFASSPTSRHCLQIASNPSVAGNIITQHHLDQKVRGVYFEGTAKKIDHTDANHPARQIYDQRFNNNAWLKAEYSSETGFRLYQITVSDFYVFDGYGPGPSGKHHLEWPNRSKVR